MIIILIRKMKKDKIINKIKKYIIIKIKIKKINKIYNQIMNLYKLIVI